MNEEMERSLVGSFLAEELGKPLEDDWENVFKLPPVGKGEEVIGELTEEEKKIKAILSTLHKRVNNKDKEIGDVPEKTFKELIEQGHLINKLFWLDVRKRLGVGDNDDIGIRQGFKLVILP